MNIAIVPARGGSKRIPEKNIVEFLGAPLMSYPIRAAEQSGLFDVIHISTDSQAIADVASRLGYPVDFMRAPELADDHTPLMPVLSWTLDQYAKRGARFEAACLLMPTAPLIEAHDLVRGFEVFRRVGGDYTVMAIARYSAPVEWAFHVETDGSLTPTQPGMASVRSQDLRPTYFDSGTFVFYPARQIEAGDVDASRMIGFPIERHKAIDIDDWEDLEFAKLVALGMRSPAS